MNILLLMMGGSGTRLGANVPKQYIELKNRPIFSYILEAHQKCEDIDKIVIVSHESWIDYVQRWVKWLNADKVMYVTAGGPNRSSSVRNGLAVMRDWADESDIILIHDATHPYCDEKGIRQVIDAVNEVGGATLGAMQYDTVYNMTTDNLIEKVLPRQYIVAGASPEAFHYQTLHDIYVTASEEELECMTSAGAIALEHKIPMKVIPANVLNLKITYANDLRLLSVLLDDFFPDAKIYAEENK